MQGDGRYRISVDKMDFLLSEGRITGVEGATLLTDTPMLKLEVVRDLFDGKTISRTRGQTGTRLRTAEKGKLALADPRRGVVVFWKTLLHLRRRTGRHLAVSRMSGTFDITKNIRITPTRFFAQGLRGHFYQSQIIIYILLASFFLYAQEKGPKRTAPLGAGPVFP